MCYKIQFLTAFPANNITCDITLAYNLLMSSNVLLIGLRLQRFLFSLCIIREIEIRFPYTCLKMPLLLYIRDWVSGEIGLLLNIEATAIWL